VCTSFKEKVAMAYVPYVPDIEAWRNHFKNFIPSRPKPFYTIKPTQNGDGNSIPKIKMVTPTEQVVEQAKAALKRTAKKRGPPKRAGKGGKNGQSKKGGKNGRTKNVGAQKRPTLKNKRGKLIK
jgi:hypothetical protein